MNPPFARADRPLIWAHRGASREAPENTLAAFTLAARQGADGIELDAQLCASGEVVVFHDTSLARTTGMPGLLAESSWTQLQKLDPGARIGSRWAGERVPLLLEVLANTPRTLLVNIELKCERPDDRGLTAAVLEAVRDARAAERVLLSSFNPLCLLRARRLAPAVPRALLFEPGASWPLRSAASAPLLDLTALHPAHSLATATAVTRWRRRYTVACWTVDDLELADSLWQRGVSGLFTNLPAQLVAHFSTHAKSTSGPADRSGAR